MNTGIQDAANLGWKLAAAVAGWGGEELLDSYHAERHPVGRQVLRSSGLLVRLALIRPRWGRAARNVVATALLGIPPISAKAAGSISAIGLRYPAPPGSDPRVGTRVPDVALRDGRTLADALRGGRFVLLGPARTPSSRGRWTPPSRGRAGNATGSTLVRPDGYVGWAGAAPPLPGLGGRVLRATTTGAASPTAAVRGGDRVRRVP